MFFLERQEDEDKTFVNNLRETNVTKTDVVTVSSPDLVILEYYCTNCFSCFRMLKHSQRKQMFLEK